MFAGADTERSVTTIPLPNAVFCVDCEIVSNSPHDVCNVCGNRSLVGLFRMLGGTLGQEPQATQKAQVAESFPTKVKYDLQLTVRVREVPARDLNHAIESITRLANVGTDLECLHISVESVVGNRTRKLLEAA